MAARGLFAQGASPKAGGASGRCGAQLPAFAFFFTVVIATVTLVEGTIVGFYL